MAEVWNLPFLLPSLSYLRRRENEAEDGAARTVSICGY
ncbi:hypothetical protein E2C01_079357 [Portunus trituberculatus]|uniref:Uncharacterized protein n=1 Tax=Portunus trituberculatus TaxID=210409 RepID=A0A5B7IQE9_PORTR|nr:hypothetical protein [Portunus trituberculatus]